MSLIPILAGMEFWGISCDPKQFSEIEIPLSESVARYLLEFRKILGWSEFDPANLQHVSVAIFDKLGIPVPEQTKRMKVPNSRIFYYSTSKKVLDQIKHVHPIINMIQVKAEIIPLLPLHPLLPLPPLLPLLPLRTFLPLSLLLSPRFLPPSSPTRGIFFLT
jgi:hypothetical protein